jgi:Mor family transcriptional regulator
MRKLITTLDEIKDRNQQIVNWFNAGIDMRKLANAYVIPLADIENIIRMTQSTLN